MVSYEAIRAYIEDGGFCPIFDWPYPLRDIYFKFHKTNNEAGWLFRFFFLNGLDPEMAADWVWGDNSGYDADSYRQRRWLVATARDSPIYFRRYLTYDCLEKRPRRMP